MCERARRALRVGGVGDRVPYPVSSVYHFVISFDYVVPFVTVHVTHAYRSHQTETPDAPSVRTVWPPAARHHYGPLAPVTPITLQRVRHGMMPFVFDGNGTM